MAKTACTGGTKTVKFRGTRKTKSGKLVKKTITFKACANKRRRGPVSRYAACVGASVKKAGPKSREQAQRALRWAAAACKGKKGIAKAGPKKAMPAGNAAYNLMWL